MSRRRDAMSRDAAQLGDERLPIRVAESCPGEQIRLEPADGVEGYALDLHTAVSRHVGQDDQGHPRFETRRTPAGELFYRLKYRGDRTAARDLVAAAAGFLRTWRPPVDMLVPVPASRGRALQPVALLAAMLAQELGLEVCRDCVRRTRDHVQLKNVHDYDARLRILADVHAVDRNRVQGSSVLLLDDLYRSGATMNSITDALYDAGDAAAVYGLALTRTRIRR